MSSMCTIDDWSGFNCTLSAKNVRKNIELKTMLCLARSSRWAGKTILLATIKSTSEGFGSPTVKANLPEFFCFKICDSPKSGKDVLYITRDSRRFEVVKLRIC